MPTSRYSAPAFRHSARACSFSPSAHPEDGHPPHGVGEVERGRRRVRPVEGQRLRVARLRLREIAQLAEDIAEVAHGVGEGERIVPLPAERDGFPIEPKGEVAPPPVALHVRPTVQGAGERHGIVVLPGQRDRGLHVAQRLVRAAFPPCAHPPLKERLDGFPGAIARFRRDHSRLATGCYPPRGTGAEVWPLRMRQPPGSWVHSIVTAPP